MEREFFFYDEYDEDLIYLNSYWADAASLVVEVSKSFDADGTKEERNQIAEFYLKLPATNLAGASEP